MIPYGRQSITDADVAAVVAALRDPYLTQGPRIAEFEERLAAACGARFAVAFNSGTATLHAAYHALGLEPGKALVTSPITFVATANAARYLGAAVRFVDVDVETVQLDPERAAEVGEGSVAAVAPVYFGGHAAAPEKLERLARSRGWAVVEDGAHALGARYTTSDGREYRVGSCEHSDMCSFSFHPVKHVTTGEGGAVTTNDPKLYRSLRRFRTHGITREADELTTNEGPWYYEQHDLGFNYRITDFQCALGISQLSRLEAFVERRREIAARYDAAFADDHAIRPVLQPSGSRSSYHIYVVRVAPEIRRRVFEALRGAGIGVNVHYIPVYRQPYYRRTGYKDVLLQNAESYYSGAITIPLFPDMTDAEVDRIIAEVRGQVRAARA